MSEPKYIAANGRKYYIQDDLSVARYMKYEELAMTLTLGRSPDAIYEGLSKAYTALTSGNDLLKGHKTAVEQIYNMMHGVKSLAETPEDHNMLLFCTLFINREDEDITEWDERLALAKIEDWKKAGLSMQLFFSLIRSAIPAFKRVSELHGELKEAASKK